MASNGYASGENISEAKALGVADVAFHKKRGLSIETMVKSRWVYRKLRNFCAGIEANISCLKRAFGLARCTWRGLVHFQVVCLVVRRRLQPRALCAITRDLTTASDAARAG